MYRILLSIKYSIVWLCVIYSIIFETIGKREIGRKFLVSVLEPCLYRGFSLVNIQLFGKWDSLIDKLQNWFIMVANILVPSFKNLPDILSILAALFTSIFLKSFKATWFNCLKCKFYFPANEVHLYNKLLWNGGQICLQLLEVYQLNC